MSNSQTLFSFSHDASQAAKTFLTFVPHFKDDLSSFFYFLNLLKLLFEIMFNVWIPVKC